MKNEHQSPKETEQVDLAKKTETLPTNSSLDDKELLESSASHIKRKKIFSKGGIKAFIRYYFRPSLVIMLSFLLIILIGSVLLYLPISLNKDANGDYVKIEYIDSLFISISAVCVTGLGTVDLLSTFNIFGRIVIAFMIQLGGLGVTTLSVILILIASGDLSFSSKSLIKESWNLDSYKSLRYIFLKVILLHVVCETVGGFLSVYSFSKNMPLDAAFGTAFFHSISSFNNAGFDIVGHEHSLICYQDDIFLNLVTSLLVIIGGLGFTVILDLFKNKFYKVKHFSLHTKVALIMTGSLLVIGFVGIKLCEWDKISHLDAWFMSVSSRTAGFATYQMKDLNDSTLIFLSLLMFIGAGPGSTGGGIKITTFFIILVTLRSFVTGKKPHAFKRSIPQNIIIKSFVIFFMAFALIFVAGISITAIEGTKVYQDATYGLKDYMFETISAFGTVGLSTGYTSQFTIGSKLILCFLMFVGRLGPLSIATLPGNRKNLSTARYVDGNISIG